MHMESLTLIWNRMHGCTKPMPTHEQWHRTHAHPKPMGMGMGTQCRALLPSLTQEILFTLQNLPHVMFTITTTQLYLMWELYSNICEDNGGNATVRKLLYTQVIG
jgi:hypothetical protein